MGASLTEMKGHFTLNLNRFRNRLGEKVSQKAVRITQTLVDTFIETSPVWGGDFRAAWNVSEGAPIFKSLDGGTPANVTPAPYIKVVAKTPFPVFYITNGQPYARRLEYGWSQAQAPYGVVRVAIAGMR